MLGPERISRIGVRCCEVVRVALLQAAARSGGTKQSITLVVDLGSWLEGEGSVIAWPSSLAPMLRVARELHDVISCRYTLRVRVRVRVRVRDQLPVQG